MKLKNNQEGIVHLAAILVVVVSVAIGIVGWKVWDSNKETKSSNNSSKGISQTNQQEQNVPDDKTKLKSEAPLCGTQESMSQKPKTTFDVNYSKPDGWEIESSVQNGIYLKSSDFSSENNMAKIIKGAHVTFTTGRYCSNGKGVNDDLLQQVVLTSNDENLKSKFITIAGYPGVEFSHNHGENRNNHKVVIFLKEDSVYKLDEQYNIDSENPYPTVIDSITKTINFK